MKSSWSNQVNVDYQLGASDIIKISIYEHPDLTMETRINASGTITFPMIGEVTIGGKTVAQAEQLIAQRLVAGEFLRRPQVTIIITQFQGQQVNVLGMVNKPGKYSLEKISHVLDLLALANGIATPAAADYATLTRADGTKVTIDINALFAGNMTQNYLINNGDLIVVPRTSMFYIYGEVQRPSTYKLEKNMTVTQAIATAGGLTLKGTDFWPLPIIKRRDTEGKEQEIDVEDSSLLLQEDDVLYVKESWF